jgi:hypothetical protein
MYDVRCVKGRGQSELLLFKRKGREGNAKARKEITTTCGATSNFEHQTSNSPSYTVHRNSYIL